MKWEYKLLKFKPSFWAGKVKDDEIEIELNNLGESGWEMCGVFDSNTNNSGRTSEIVFTLKRQKQ
jgi:hypothetical protein